MFYYLIKKKNDYYHDYNKKLFYNKNIKRYLNKLKINKLKTNKLKTNKKYKILLSRNKDFKLINLLNINDIIINK